MRGEPQPTLFGLPPQVVEAAEKTPEHRALAPASIAKLARAIAERHTPALSP